MRHTVNTCCDCPLQYDTMQCKHPSDKPDQGSIVDEYYEDTSPDWCPLKSEELTLVLKASKTPRGY